MAAALAKYRINPGNVGAKRHDEHFATIVQVAIDNGKPVRIGVNWGSLDQAILTELMDANAALAEPRDARDVMIEAMLQSALRSAELAEADRARARPDHHQRQGLRRPRPGGRLPAARGTLRLPAPPRPDRGRMGDKGIVASTAGLAILLNEGIGDTIRVSLTPEPGAPRASARSRSRSRSSSRWACARSCRRCRRARAAAGRPRPSSRRWPSRSRAYLKDRMPEWRETHPGRRGPARRRHGLRRQRPGRVASMPTSASASRARSRSRSPRSSSTAASTGRCAATASSPNSSPSSRTTSRGGSRPGDARRLTRPERLCTGGPPLVRISSCGAGDDALPGPRRPC